MNDLLVKMMRVHLKLFNNNVTYLHFDIPLGWRKRVDSSQEHEQSLRENLSTGRHELVNIVCHRCRAEQILGFTTLEDIVAGAKPTKICNIVILESQTRYCEWQIISMQ